MICIPLPFDLIILYFPFLPRQSPFCAPHFFIFFSSYYFPRPFFVYMAFNILLFLREWPAQARELGVDTFFIFDLGYFRTVFRIWKMGANGVSLDRPVITK